MTTDRLFFNFEIISKYRAELMGIAILMILFFHYGLPIPVLSEFSKFGNCGVDVFFFLSSFGLCFSIQKNTTSNFYKRRYLRILPMYWIVLAIMHYRLYLMGEDYPSTLFECMMYYSGLGWLFRGLFSMLGLKGVFYYEWYIPTLLLFYLLFPLFYKLSTKRLLQVLIISVIVGFSLAAMELNNSIHLSYRRLPIFLYGILFYKNKKNLEQRSFSKLGVWAIIAVCLIIVYLCDISSFKYSHINRYIYSLSFGLICPLLLMILANVMEKLQISKPFAWFGAFTLELYLVHIYRWPMTILNSFVPYPPINYVLAIIISIGLAYMLHLADSYIRRLITNKATK